MIRAAALLVSATFAALALLHLYWAAGGGWGASAALPEVKGAPAFRPGRAATVGVALLLFAAARVIAARAGWWPLDAPAAVPVVGSWGVAIVMLARAVGDFRLFGFAKRIKGTRFARLDTIVYSPLCAALAAGSALTAYFGR